MVSVTIDNVNVKIPRDSTILEACDFAGVVVPRFCFHEKLMIAGNCRMCIVEIEKFPKPISSCTMNVNEGMKIYTKTPMVKKAQESVLEFLLINHPLDCPICDQGGECDLQDQLLFFGSDSSRFFNYKRGVEDKNCSLLVKTIMTRCIHCTRCVRFLTKVAGDHNLGVLGRSSQAEIGLYLEKNLESELSGNIIDLCPVGALTSKPYSFKGRSWELTNYKSIDILDGLGSNILLSAKGSEIMRVLPDVNEGINMEWISDKTRFSYDSFDYLRIKKIWSKSEKSFISWSTVLADITNNLKTQKVGMVLGGLIDVEATISAKSFLNNLGSSNLYAESLGLSGEIDNRSDYLFNSTLVGVEECDVCLLLGVDPRKEASMLNIRLRKQVTEGNLVVGYVGSSLDLTYEAFHLGTSRQSIYQILKGTHPFCKTLKKAKNPCIIVGSSVVSISFINNIKRTLIRAVSSLNPINFNILNDTASSTAFSEIGVKSLNKSELKDLNTLFLAGTDSVEQYRRLNRKAFIIYIGSHYSVKGLEEADLILPSSLFIEKSCRYMNTEGKIQKTSRVRSTIGDSRTEWFLFRTLSYLSKKGVSSYNANTLKLFESRVRGLYPFIGNNNNSYYNFNHTLKRKSINGFLNSGLENFYENNFLTKSSKTMLLCSEKQENKTFLQK